jgi:hypothetical protein
MERAETDSTMAKATKSSGLQGLLDGEARKPSLVYRCIVKILGRDPSGEMSWRKKL